MNVIDLFAGPGGWDVAARQLGLDPLGIEWDDAACATRKAAGLRTEQADVAALDPASYGNVDGLIASPPCQAWSMAGKRTGEVDKANVYACADGLARGEDDRHHYLARCTDPRSLLVVEPVRWVRELRPAWVTLEQVPPVLELWEHYVYLFRQWGYSVWAGVLNAADYGVPQTRQRAILIARRDGPPATPPEPTHCKGGSEPTMFGDGLLPWVSMSQALGWDESATVKKPYGEGMTERWGQREETPASSVATTVISKARSWVLRNNTNDNAAVRAPDEPAPTLFFGHRLNNVSWVRDRFDPELVASGEWVQHGPATTVCGDPRIFAPGGHHTPGAQSQNAIRITVEEAAALQSFPPDYPWQGSRTKQFEQIGNAVPPRLAAHVLAAVLDLELEVAA